MNLSAGIPEFLAGGGEMGQRIRDFNWSATPLGPVNTWPQSLRTCIRIMLTSRQPIWIGWGKDLIKLYNDPYKGIVGGKHPRALGQPASVVWKDIWKDIEPLLQRVMEEDEGTYVESQLLIMERNGYPEETYYTFSYTPIPGDDGGTAGMICANTDDTERIIGERQLRTLTELGKKLNDSKSDRDIFLSVMHTLRENRQDFPFALMYHLSGDHAQLVGTTEPVVSPDIPQRLDLKGKGDIELLLAKAAAEKKRQVFSKLDGFLAHMPRGVWSVRPHQAIVLPVIQSGQKDPYAFFILGLNPYRLLDERYESFLKLVIDQVATSFANVHVMEEERKRAEALAALDMAKTTFFSNISHEFRTPLTLLLGPIEDALNDTSATPENKMRMDVAHRNALRMLKLVNTLLEFSRIEAGRLQARFQQFDVCAFTQDLVSNFRSAVEKAGMELIIECDKIEGLVYLDPDMWEKIVLNLVSNAFKYSKAGKIKVELRAEEAGIALSVTDTGIGIPESELENIFDRFHRVQDVQGRSQEGTGIGLAMVKELVRLHHGSISVSSKLSEGSVFTVRVPWGGNHLPADKIIETSGVPVSSQATAFINEAMKWVPDQDPETKEDVTVTNTPEQEEKSRVLLADDNADMREYVGRLLSDQFIVTAVTNGEDAFEVAMRERPDLVLTDIMMPVLDGFGLLKKLRAANETKNIPVIFLSARAGEEARVEGLDAGADDYLVKPFSARELMVRVANHIKMNQVRRATEQQFLQLFKDAPIMIHVLRGPEHIFEFFDPKGKGFVGGIDATGMAVRDVMPQAEAQQHVQLLDEVYRTGQSVTRKEMQSFLPDGNGHLTERYFDFIYQAWKDHRGITKGVMNLVIDVTEQVLSRKKIEESETYFRRMSDTVPAIIWVTDSEGRCTHLNRQWYEYTGQQESEALGFGWLDATHPDDKEQSGNIFREANAKQVPFHIIYRLRNIKGEYRWAIDSGRPRFNADGAFEGYIGTVVDIHERKTAQDSLIESQRGLAQMANAMPQLVWVAEPDGTVSYYNDRISEYAGSHLKENGQWEWKGMLHPDDQEPTDQAWKDARRTGGIYQKEHRIRMTDGSYRWHLSRALPQKNEKGEIVKWFGTATEIQVFKEQEKILEEQVRERTEELSEMNISLQQSNEGLQQFAHVASHDLKEPLRKIKTFAGRLEEDTSSTLSGKSRVFLEKIHSATDRMFAMIEGVLNYSTVNGQQQYTETVDLNNIMDNIVTDLEILIAQKQASVEYSGLPVLEGASILIYQLFYNLINNSLKFSTPDRPPVISISSTVSRENGGVAIITVKDNGIGFEQEYAERIFNTFARLNSKDKYEGTGLGLALCRKIVQRHGGSIRAESNGKEGAAFMVELPLKQLKKHL
jgi:PAS domain S-box-containing protein